MPVQMHINATRFMEKLMQEYSGLIKPLKVGIETAPPCVSVSLLLQNRGLFCESRGFVFLGVRIVRNRCCEGEIRACVEGRVYINEIDLAGELRQQTRQDVLLVAADQSVAPRHFPPSGKEIKGTSPVLRAFVDRLDGLKRKGNPDRRDLLAVLVFPLPGKFSHPKPRCCVWSPFSRAFRDLT